MLVITTYHYYIIYIKKDKKYRSGKSFLKREKRIGIRSFYIIWILFGLLENKIFYSPPESITVVQLMIVLLLLIIVLNILHKKYTLKYWRNFDKRKYENIDKGNPYQPMTRFENEIENKYYIEVEKYLSELEKES